MSNSGQYKPFYVIDNRLFDDHFVGVVFLFISFLISQFETKDLLPVWACMHVYVWACVHVYGNNRQHAQQQTSIQGFGKFGHLKHSVM